jgi:hypothetical protein
VEVGVSAMLDRMFDAIERIVLRVTPGYVCPVCKREGTCDTCVETQELEAARRRCADWLTAPAKGPRNPAREPANVEGESPEPVFDSRAECR